MSVRIGGRLLGGAVAAALFALLAAGSAGAATLAPGLVCKPGGEPAAANAAGLEQRARGAERMLASDAAELELKVDNLERELMADGPGG